MLPIDLDSLCREHGPNLRLPEGLNGPQLLRALAEVESSGGKQNIPRFEPAYSIGGFYYRNAKHVREAWATWGDHAACSYSSWQILYIVALELGYKGPPADLWSDAVAAPWVVDFINRRITGRGAKTLRDIADAYNSGSFADQVVPEQYIGKVNAAYHGLQARGWA